MLSVCQMRCYLSETSPPLSFVILWLFGIFGWCSVSRENEGYKKQEGGSVTHFLKVQLSLSYQALRERSCHSLRWGQWRNMLLNFWWSRSIRNIPGSRFTKSTLCRNTCRKVFSANFAQVVAAMTWDVKDGAVKKRAGLGSTTWLAPQLQALSPLFCDCDQNKSWRLLGLGRAAALWLMVQFQVRKGGIKVEGRPFLFRQISGLKNLHLWIEQKAWTHTSNVAPTSRDMGWHATTHDNFCFALCVRLNRKWEIGIFTKTSTSSLIFLMLNYFRSKIFGNWHRFNCLTDTWNMFFTNDCHIFDKYVMAIFFL